MTRSFVQWGVSALNDAPLLSVSPDAQGAFPWLLLQAAMSDGILSRIAAVRFLHGRGWSNPDIVVDELLAAGLIVDGGLVSGWEKYQAQYHLRNSDRATTREGRRHGLNREQDINRVEQSTPHTAAAAWNDPQLSTYDPHPRTVDLSTRAVASPLFSSPRTTPEDVTGGPRGTKLQDRDIQDTLYELRSLRPWGKDWGQQALALVTEFGLAADATLRSVAAEEPAAKPWNLVKLTRDRLERDREKAKTRERLEATKNRTARTEKMGRITPEEFSRLTYAEPEAKAHG